MLHVYLDLTRDVAGRAARYCTFDAALGVRRINGRQAGDRDNPWTVVSALFASMFDDRTIAWLNKRGYLTWDQPGQAEAIIAAVNALIGRQR